LILLIDNYDSFVFNLARYFQRLGQQTMVVRNDAIDAAAVRKLDPTAIVISPGPCTPTEAGCSLQLVKELHRQVPILGVCLGHQAIGQAFGASVVRADAPAHGRSSNIYHVGTRLFAGLANPTTACRYHSLILERQSVPPQLEVSAWLDDGVVMAIEHREFPVFGVQFHPESVLTNEGYPLLANFLRLAGCDVHADINSLRAEMPSESPALPPPLLPVTF
jgi:anthranilate synthase component II